MGGKKYTPEQIDYLKSIAMLPNAEMAEHFNQKFGTTKNAKSMRDWCHRYRFLKGVNTGRFKKGGLPWNKGNPLAVTTHKPVGHERLDMHGYIRYKPKGSNTMVVKHRYIWEINHGPIPNDMMVVFKDGDRSNCTIDNLMLMSRPELVRYNNMFRSIATRKTNETCLILAKLKAKSGQLSRGAA